jgi:hypothetical protein
MSEHSDARRHLLIPDTQVRRGVPLEHLKAAAQAIVHYKPDVIVHIGDHWDMPSCNRHIEPGSMELEGARIREDIEVGNEAWETLFAPMHAEIARLKTGKRKYWTPRLVYCRGNHEDRLDRLVGSSPMLEGVVSTDMMLTPGFERKSFLEITEIDGIWYSHYFANTHSGRAIGGSIDNRLNRIGRSFVQGHEQGFLYGVRQFPGKLTRHGLVAGSFYMHDEKYRGLQSNSEWRGIVVLNEVRDGGNYDIMPLSMDYLLRKYV